MGQTVIWDKNIKPGITKEVTPVDTVTTDLVVNPGDADAARKRRAQILAGQQNRIDYIDNTTGEAVTTLLQDTPRAQEIKKQIEDAELSRLNREIDLSRGRARGMQDFYEGSLGRVGEDVSADIQSIQQARMDIAQNGFGADAFQAAREQRLDSMQRGQMLQQRQLKAGQAAGGVFGGLAGGQRMSLMEQQQEEQQEAERDLFLDEVRQRQEALGAAESTTRNTEQDVLARQQYNQAQKRRELMGLLTAQYGEAALGVAERTSSASLQAAKEYAAGVASQAGGGKK